MEATVRNPVVIEGEVARIGLQDRQGNLVAEVLIDAADLELVAPHRWCRQGKGKRYAYTNLPEGGGMLMHRLLLQPPEGMEVDHVNGDGLDNRRANLRVVSHRVNSRNRQGANRNGSLRRGVVRHPRGWYEAHIRITCDTYEEAVEMRERLEEAAGWSLR